jgi:tRNA pseudouridine55 synthase
MNLSGFLNLYKPPGITSHAAMVSIRRPAKARAGHCGTLDPAAQGVLVVCVGKATRLVSFTLESDKEYRAEIAFGVGTNTFDGQGQVTAIVDAKGLTAEAVRDALAEFAGEIKQRPPSFSAIRVHGQKAYTLARRGEHIVLPERPVVAYELQLLDFRPGHPAVGTVHVRSSKGFYVRSLARDLGERLGLPAHLSFLLRTRVGVFKVDESVTLEEAQEAARSGELAERLTPLDAPLAHLARVFVEGREAELVRNGAAVPWSEPLGEGPVRVYDEHGNFLALANPLPDGQVQPSIVFAEES